MSMKRKSGQNDVWMMTVYCLTTMGPFLTPETFVWRKVVLVAAAGVLSVVAAMYVRARLAGRCATASAGE
jgi:hypothetical protein